MKITRIIFLTAAVIVSKGYAEAEKAIYLQKGETHRIELDSSPGSTGYNWVLLPLPEDAAISVIDKGWERKKDVPANVCGAPGKSYWVIKAHDNLTKRQIIQLTLHEKGPGLNEPSEVREYTIYVH
jgi:predicted secreted protein